MNFAPEMTGIIVLSVEFLRSLERGVRSVLHEV